MEQSQEELGSSVILSQVITGKFQNEKVIFFLGFDCWDDDEERGSQSKRVLPPKPQCLAKPETSGSTGWLELVALKKGRVSRNSDWSR